MLSAREKENAIENFVSREIFACQSMLVEEAFKDLKRMIQKNRKL